ncbi:MAG: phosphopantothenoylcysteine decarboxylase domain-containing protein [Planctomycetota bacterium]|jgi:phosphopantothenoylcysteine decarboxylase/phosphopantothenate--cysteine ligase
MAVVLVTAGPTREYLDEVRYLSNGSSGRMGYAVAGAAQQAGHRVVLVTGPVALDPPPGVSVVAVVSAREMLEAVMERLADTDVVFGVAAVADYRPAERATGKPQKATAEITLRLLPNPDILATVGEQKGRRVVVGFALEAGDAAAALERGKEKLQRKRLDLIAVNQVDAVDTADNEVVLLHADGRQERLPRMDKQKVAAHLVAAAMRLWESGGG